MVINKIKDLRKELTPLRNQGKTIALVPTMGGLHKGHIALVKKANEVADITVVSIFVNPAQFNSKSDYKNYQRNLKDDLKKLSNHKVDYVFTPTNEEIYPKGFNAKITINAYNDCLCAKYRPGHFEGVALVVTKLFNIVNPTHAVFGEKDFQQLKIVQKLAEDLSYDIEIVSVPTVRQKSGLVLSSRNKNLSSQALELSSQVYSVLQEVRKNIISEQSDLAVFINDAKNKLSESGIVVEYLDLRLDEDLRFVDSYRPDNKVRLFIAVVIDQVRLIDNILIDGQSDY